MRKYFLLILLSVTFLLSSKAQYGNEWIDFNKTYYKFKIASDGIYRIPQSVLANAGLSGIPGSQFRLYRLGAEVAVFTSTDGVFSGTDFIEFYGLKNRGELDRELFQDPDLEQLNPDYSMFTDLSTYFLTWDENGSGMRISGIENDLSNPPAAETFYMHEDEWVYADDAIDPRNYSAETFISYSRYQEGEGFGSSEISAFTLDIPGSLIAPQGPDAALSVRFSSATFTPHDIDVLFNGDTMLNGGNFIYSHLYQLNKSVPAGQIVSNQVLDIKDYEEHGKFAMAAVKWTYPRQFDFTGNTSTHFAHASVGDPQYFELTNFNHGGEDPVIYDLASRVRLLSKRDGNTIQFRLPEFTGERDIVVSGQQLIQNISALTPRTFTDFSADNPEYIIITHPSLRNGADVVNQYAQYRSSPVGGGYNVGIYNVLDLYDQFGYGTQKHPQAIRNFNRLIRDQWDAAKIVLLVGKGIVYKYSREHESDEEQNLLVPTFGNPGADNLLFTTNGVSLPTLQVGRLPVSDPDQLQVYLSKVIEYDQVTTLPQTIADREWTKHILHMGGGRVVSEQDQILGHLNQMASNAINNEFGAYVTTFTKTTTNVTGESNSDQILNILHDGTSIVKFFGHSSASTLDFQINNPRDWKNKGRYPIFSAMGCKSGDIHLNFLSLSENFVFEPDGGAIAFLAGSGSQFLGTLGSWGRDWYLTFGQGVNEMTLGETILESLGSLNQFGLPQVLLIEQQTLNGDPALRFYSSPGPDYVWDYKSVKHDPEVLTTNEASFTLSADVVNLGTNRPDTIIARVEQKFSDGSVKQVGYDTVFVRTFRTTLDFVIPIDRNSTGLNTFYLTIDALNETIELPNPSAEDNNELTDGSGKTGYDIFILDNRAKATYPLEFSIVTESFPEFIANSINAFVKEADFVIELDTSPDFSSGMLMREFFSGFGGVLRWKPLFPFQAGKVYYWRVSEASNNDNYIWDSSSFLYNPGGQKGWNQSHYGQFQKDVLQNLDFDNHNRIDFDTVYRNIWVQNKVDFDPTTRDDDPVVFINNNLRRDFFTEYDTFDAHVSVIVIDSFNGRFLRNAPGGQYGAVNPTTSSISVFPFNTSTSVGRNSLMTFLSDVVQEGMYVILFTYQRPGFMDYYPEMWEADEQTLGRSIFSVIEELVPGSEIRSLATKGPVPYLLYYRNNNSLIYESIANQLEETLSYDYNFISRASTGDIISTLIGPARSWHGFEWDFQFSDNPGGDIVQAELIALSKTMTDTLRVDVTSVQDTLLDFINADQYPFIYLRFHVEDVPNLTAPYVDFWRVLYEGVPDLFINPAGGFDFEKDTLMIGQTMGLTTSIENLGADMLESYPVRFTITDEQNNIIVLTEDVPALKSGESTLVHISKELSNGAGRNILFVEVNPDRNMLESSFLNNTGILTFLVLDDRTNPLLDVTFDGRHLVNGDIVSSQPAIVAKLYDENPYILLNDLEAFQILLQYPGDVDYTEINIHAPEISFEPAISGTENIATLTFRPLLEDGYYEMIIRAHDRANNDAGSIDYAVSFNVLGEGLLSRVDAEPKWFYDYTRFIFTISGSEVPSDINLQIVNVAGQIVREIGKEEIGLFVGTTEYVWDGTTDSGESLPGGVYFYRLTAKDASGNEYSNLGSGFQSLRNAHVGKVVIVR